MAWFGAMNCGAFICQQQCLRMAKGQPGFWDLAWMPCEVLRESCIWTPQPLPGPKTQGSGLGTHQELGGEQRARVKKGGADRERDWGREERDRVRGFGQELARKRLAVFLLEPDDLGPATWRD